MADQDQDSRSEVFNTFGDDLGEILVAGGLASLSTVRQFAQEGRLQEVDGVGDAKEAQILAALEELDADEAEPIIPEDDEPETLSSWVDEQLDELEDGDDEARAEIVSRVEELEGHNARLVEEAQEHEEFRAKVEGRLETLEEQVGRYSKMANQTTLLKQIANLAHSDQYYGHSLGVRQAKTVLDQIYNLASQGIVEEDEEPQE